MRKKWQIALITFAIILAIVAASGLYVKKALPTILSGLLTKLMQTEVSIKTIDLSTSEIALIDLDIQNPGKSPPVPKAAATPKIAFHAPLINYIKPHIEIPKIEIKDFYISLIFYDSSMKQGNWVEIATAINNYEPTLGSSHSRTFLIKELELTDIVIDLKRYGKENLRLKPIKRLVLHNIGSARGLPMKELSRIVVRQVIRSISVASGIQDMLVGVASAPAAAVQTLVSPFTFFFGGGKKETQTPAPQRAPRTPSERNDS